jgi:hypothetical protein
LNSWRDEETAFLTGKHESRKYLKADRSVIGKETGKVPVPVFDTKERFLHL